MGVLLLYTDVFIAFPFHVNNHRRSLSLAISKLRFFNVLFLLKMDATNTPPQEYCKGVCFLPTNQAGNKTLFEDMNKKTMEQSTKMSKDHPQSLGVA